MAKKNKKVKKTQPQPKAEKDEDAITWDDIAACPIPRKKAVLTMLLN